MVNNKSVTLQNCVQSTANSLLSCVNEKLPSSASLPTWLGRTISTWPSWLSEGTFSTLRLLGADLEPNHTDTVHEHLPVIDVLQNIVIDYCQLHHTEVEQIIREEITNLYPPFSHELQKKLDAIKRSNAEQLDLHDITLCFPQDGHKYLRVYGYYLKRLETIVSVLPHLKNLSLAKATIGSTHWVGYIKIIAEKLHELEVLDLSNTTVDDHCVDALAQLKQLKRLVICQTSSLRPLTESLTMQGKANLKQMLPNLEIVDT